MDKLKALEIVTAYYRAVCEAYRLGNTESAYNAPIIGLISQFGCAPRDMSGERKGQSGENIDIKLWHTWIIRHSAVCAVACCVRLI